MNLYDQNTIIRIAEYDGNNNLLRKYIYGPGIDQPVCMIEPDESETYYYHYDALGSVVALSDSSGDTVQTYEYSVYGQPAVEDINHPNPYMFAGRRFDIEIGLYYNRARYYNPYTGRFLQTDPIGYEDGMNMYLYCRNNPLIFIDPSGTEVPVDPADLYYMDPLNSAFDPLLSRICPQPSNWQILQYFFWYRWGKGKKVNLANTGLLDLFKSDPQIVQKVADFESNFLEWVQESWNDFVKYKKEHPEDKDATWSPPSTQITRYYSFDGVVEAVTASPLFVLGDGYFRLKADCEGENDGSYTITFHYYVVDVFRDPNPLRKFNPFAKSTEFENCTPYIMYGAWENIVKGKCS